MYPFSEGTTVGNAIRSKANNPMQIWQDEVRSAMFGKIQSEGTLNMWFVCSKINDCTQGPWLVSVAFRSQTIHHQPARLMKHFEFGLAGSSSAAANKKRHMNATDTISCCCFWYLQRKNASNFEVILKKTLPEISLEREIQHHYDRLALLSQTPCSVKWFKEVILMSMDMIPPPTLVFPNPKDSGYLFPLTNLFCDRFPMPTISSLFRVKLDTNARKPLRSKPEIAEFNLHFDLV